jgi:hypothetical protein
MIKYIITILIGAVIAVGVVLFIRNPGLDQQIMRLIPDQHKKRERELLDSIIRLNVRVAEVERDRRADSLRFATKLNSNSQTNERLIHAIEKVSFKDYSDRQLDSLVNVLYPQPGFAFEW